VSGLEERNKEMSFLVVALVLALFMLFGLTPMEGALAADLIYVKVHP
jgi:hypothetical protein